MKIGFFTMPIHPLGKNWRQSLAEDREAFILADQLGFSEGYVGEHASDQAENITSCAIFIATLIDATKNMRLGTGTVNMPNTHPVAVASQIAMLDHLLDGRFNFGISPGGLLSDSEAFGNLDRDRTAMFVEAIDMVLAIWNGQPPYNLSGKFWEISTARTMMPEIGQGTLPKPLQRPNPPIVVTAVAPFSKGLASAAERGWLPISANFLLPKWVATHWTQYASGCNSAGRSADSSEWRIAKSIFVADNPRVAREYALGPKSPYRYYFSSLVSKLRSAQRLAIFKDNQAVPDEDITVDRVLDDLVIWGTPDKVIDELLKFRETTGDFGTLLYAGHDWADPTLAKHSMRLMATEVMPQVNAVVSRQRLAHVG